MSLEELINDFCNCILDEHRHDFLNVEVFDSEVAFFKKYESFFKGKIKIENWDSDALIQQYTYKSCNNYFKKVLLLQHTPYDFYDSVSMRKHIECLRRFFRVTYRKTLPPQIEKIYVYISLKAEEFQNMQTYFNEQIEFASEYKSELLHEELDEYGSIIEKNTNKSIELFEQTEALDKKIKDAEKNIKKVEEEIKNAENRSAKKMTETSVTVLGIFSAVILTFNGALSLSASVLQSISEANVYRLLLVSLVIGLVSFNLIYALFHYLNVFRNKLSGKEEGENLKKQGHKSLRIFWITDIILVVLMALTVLAWWNGAVEIRNEKFDYNEPVSESSSIDSSETQTQETPETAEE